MAEWNDNFGEEDEEENEEGESTVQWGTKDGLIMLIDCTKPMFNKDDEDESRFDLCIKCAKSVIQNKIISSEKDLMGIVFFGTEKATNAAEFKHIYILHELAQPGAEKVLQLEKLLENPNNDDFETKFGHNTNFSLADALWTCSNMFSNCSQKLGFKRVMLFTNTDNPHTTSPQLRTQAAAKAEDLHQNSIDLVLMHMNQQGKPFDLTLFYKDILYTDDDEVTATPDPADRFEELLTRVRSKNYKKRATTRIPLSLGPGISLSVGVYNLVRTCTKPAPVKLYRKNNDEVKTVTKMFLTDTAEVLLPQDLKKCQQYAGRQICFEPEEVVEIKQFGSQGLQLMGFKNKSCIKSYFHVRPAQFIYPDDASVVGSTTLFTALLKKCLEKDVVAICRYIPRKNTPPRFVALWPQEEEVDEHKVQVTPPGFHLLFLPFADDFRKVKLPENQPRATTLQVEKAKELVKKLQFSFRSESFENPSLQTHYANIEAMALDRDAPDEITDFTLPDDTKIDKRAGKIMDEFKDLVFPAGYAPGAKRKAGGGGGGPVNKAAKTEEVDIDVEAEAKAGRLGKLTVPILKEVIKRLKVKNLTGTTKPKLIEAINAHYGL